jgi:integrase
MTRTAIRRLFSTVAKAAKLPGLTPHAIRRYAITGVVKDHGLRHGQRFARHASSKTTERYDTRPQEEVLAEIASGDRVGALRP